MASVPRVSRILGLSLRARAAVMRPAAVTYRWRCLATASHPAWSRNQRSESRVASLEQPLVIRRGMASESISAQELEESVLNVLKLFDKVDPTKVTLEAHFLNDLGLDSLDTVEVVMGFEDEFGVEISDEEAEKIFTCKDAIELLKTKLDLH